MSSPRVGVGCAEASEPFIGGDSVSLESAERFSTFAAAAIGDIVIAAIPAVRKHGGINAGEPIENTNKVRKEDSTIETASASGASVNAAA